MAKDPFTKFFKMIGGIFSSIALLFKMVLDIQNILKCPVKIWNNIGSCLYYWAMDTIILVIYFVFYWVLYIFFYIPIWIGTFMLCLFLRKKYDGFFCFELLPEHVIPSKDAFCFPFEFAYYKLSGGGRFIYRNKQDIGNCYCILPLKYAFQPYEKFSDFNPSKEDKRSSAFMYLIIALGLLLLIHATNAKGTPPV